MDQATQLRNLIKSAQETKVTKRPLSRVITVTSGKGGVGKSNTAINLALQFKKLGKRVIILDADFGLANIEIMFGTVPKHNFCDLIYQGKEITDIITWGPGDVGFISGGSGIAGLLSAVFGCTLMAPHGGIFVFATVGNPILYIVAWLVGSIITAVLLGFIKKNKE